MTRHRATFQTNPSVLHLSTRDKQYVYKADGINVGWGLKADVANDEGMSETDGSDVTLTWSPHIRIRKFLVPHTQCWSKRLLQGNDSKKYAHEDSYKEKTSKPTKEMSTFFYYKSSNTLTNQGTHNSPPALAL